MRDRRTLRAGVGGLAAALLGSAVAWGSACTSFSQSDAADAAPPEASAADALAVDAAPATCETPRFIDTPSALQPTECAGKTVDISSDTTHCGACNHRCEGCSAGRCPSELVATPSAPVLAVAAQGAVFYADTAGFLYTQGVKRAPQAGGANVPYLALAVDATRSTTWIATAEKLGSYDGAGGVGNLEALPASSVALGSSLVFWVDGAGVYRRLKTGGAVAQVAAKSATKVAAVGDVAYWVAPSKQPGQDAVWESPTFTDADAKELARAPKITDLAADQSHVYFVEESTSVVHRVPRSGGSAQPVAKEMLGKVRHLLVGPDFLYWAADRSGGAAPGSWAVVRVSLCGGVPATLVPELGMVSSLAFDGDSLYFVASPGRLGRVAR